MAKKAESVVMQEEIESLKKCLKDKDKRIHKIEKRYENIVDLIVKLWYCFWVPFSYFLLGHAWCIIGSNGNFGILGYFGHISAYFNAPYNSELGKHIYDFPEGIEGTANGVLFAVMVCMIITLTAIWIAWFAYYDQIHGDD